MSNNEIDDVPFVINSNRKSNKSDLTSVKIMLGLNLVGCLMILTILIGMIIFAAKNLPEAQKTLLQAQNTLNRTDSLLNHVEQIPNIDWEFLTSQKEQEDLIDLIRTKVQMIPAIDWDFFTNSTEQTRLIHMIQKFINSGIGQSKS